MKTQKSLRINIYCDGMPFNGDTLKTESLGGTETAVLQTAKAFVDYGHKVTVLTNTNKLGVFEGVEYRNVNQFNESFVQEPHDVSLIIRHPMLFSSLHNSKINILWQHDLGFTNDKDEFLGNTWNIDNVWCQSPFHKEQYLSVMGLPDDLYWVAGSAIDPDLLPKKEIKRDKKKLVYTGRPERGLEALATGILPKLLEHDPELKLHVATYNNFTPLVMKVINRIKKKTEKFKDSIIWHPPLTKKELYELFSSAYLYLYPVTHYDKIIGNFEETYCLTIDECMACGLPFISRPLGAIPDTLGKGAGLLIDKGDSNTHPEFQQQYVDTVIYLLKNNVKWESMSKAGKEIALTEDTWKVRAKTFLDKIHELIEKKEKQPVKLSVGILNRKQDKNNLQRCVNSVKKIATSNPELHTSIRIYNELDEWDGELNVWDNLIENSKSADWVLWLYGSEVLKNPHNIPKYLKNNVYQGYCIEKKKYTLKNDLNDILFDDMLDNPPRLFKTDKDIIFEGKVFSRPVNKHGGPLSLDINYFEHILKDVSIIDFSDGIDSFDYFKNTHSVLENGSCWKDKFFYLMKGYMVLALMNKGINEKKVTANCQKVINLYKSHYLGDMSKLGREALRFYSQANELLGAGFFMNFTFGVDRQKQPTDKSIMNVKLNSLKDAEEIIKPLIKERVESITNKYYLVR